MTGLELKYRLLMRAYPPDHRARHEDEIVSTLLDVATSGQRHPRPREAAAILTAGLGCRIQDSSELGPGLRLAGIVALATTFGLSAMAIVLAAQRPLEIGLIPVLAWIAVLAASVFSCWATSTYRVVPVAAISLLMVAAGSSAMGLRRSTVVPAAVLLLLSALSRSARRSVRLTALLAGFGLGAVFGGIVSADINQVFQNSDSLWVYVAQWDIASDLVPANSPLLFIACLAVTIVAVLWRRLRYAVAASVLAVPFVPAILFSERGLLPNLTAAHNFALLSIIAASLTLGIAIGVSWFGRHRLSQRVPKL